MLPPVACALMVLATSAGVASQDFLEAVAGGNLTAAERAVQNGAEVGERDRWGRDPLYVAVSSGHLEMAKWLLKQGAAVDAKRKDGWTPLMQAAYEGQLEMVQWLHSHRAAIDARSKDGTTPLMAALFNEHLEVAQWLRGQFNTSWEEDCGMGRRLHECRSAPALTEVCLKGLTKEAADCWLQAGANPWGSLDGTPYYFHILDPAVKAYWQQHMTLAAQVQWALHEPKAYLTLLGGAVGGLLLQTRTRTVAKPYMAVPAGLPTNFHAGARLLAARLSVSPSWKLVRAARVCEVLAGVVFPFFVVMFVIWWPVALPLWAVAFLLPGLRLHGRGLLRNPGLCLAAGSSGEVLLGCLRAALLLALVFNPMTSPARLGELPIANRMVHTLYAKMDYLHYQTPSLPDFLAGPWQISHPQGPLFANAGPGLANAEQLIAGLFLVLCASQSAYIVGSLVYLSGQPCCLGQARDGSGALLRKSFEDQRRIFKRLLEEGPVSEVTAEEGFNLRNPLGGLWVRVSLMVLDVFLDANTIITLIRAEQYECAFLLQVVVTRSLVLQIATGNLYLREAVRASLERGVLRNDLHALFEEEKGVEAFLSLAITSYSLMYAVNTYFQVVTQSFSILLSVYGLSTHLFEQLDLGLADDWGEDELLA
ncbi:unnamed protein product [Effrenium voratum]|nr:unnamed protein product [Effrenium voratum]